MASRSRLAQIGLLVPEPIRRLPADLIAVVTLVILACAGVLVPGINETPLRIIVGLPLVLFLPGYVLVAALFPEAGESPATDDSEFSEQSTNDGDPTTGIDTSTNDDTETDAEQQTDQNDDTVRFGAGTARGIDSIERVALSFGLSIAVVPLLGLVLNFTPWGIRLLPILVSLSGFTLGMTAVAATRRRALPASERFRVPYRRWIGAGRDELFNPKSRVDGILNVILVCSILLAVGSVAYAVAVPPQGETFTEFYILTEDEEDNLVAADYPTEFEVGEPQPVVVGVGNHEAETMSYTVVVQLQEVRMENNETTVLERTEIDRLSSPQISDNDTWQQTHALTPTRPGEQLRVQYLLYRDTPPSAPTGENAYRELHLWIDVDVSATNG